MSDNSPSLQEWKALYDAALEFKKMECWNWMWDSDIFGVQNPETGEIGYCCIMGMLGEYYALALYLGTEGLEGYLKTRSGEFSPDNVLHIQKCLMVSFEDRKFLKKQDLTLIKELNLKFRGRNEWPLFRSYLPGYAPWVLTRVEAQFLTQALQQAIGVCLRFKDDEELFTPPLKGYYLVRVFKKEKNEWADEWLSPPPQKRSEPVVIPLDEPRLKKIKEIITKRQMIWEIGLFFSPAGVREKGERPYFPHIILWVDHYSGLIVKVHLTEPEEYASEFVDQFLNLLEKGTFAPEEILVKREELFTLLEPITSYLGINMKKVNHLPALEKAQTDMYEFFQQMK